MKISLPPRVVLWPKIITIENGILIQFKLKTRKRNQLFIILATKDLKSIRISWVEISNTFQTRNHFHYAMEFRLLGYLRQLINLCCIFVCAKFFFSFFFTERDPKIGTTLFSLSSSTSISQIISGFYWFWEFPKQFEHRFPSAQIKLLPKLIDCYF